MAKVAKKVLSSKKLIPEEAAEVSKVAKEVEVAKSAKVMKLKRLGVLSVAKVYTLLMAVFGLLLGIFYAFLIVILGSIFAPVSGSSVNIGSLIGLGFVFIIVYPILFGVLGFITGVVGAFLYNLIAEKIGGVEMEFEEK